MTRPSSGGPGLFWVIDTHLRRLKASVRLETPIVSLIRTPNNEIRGVVIGGPNGTRRIAARRAVVLACGGFEANAEMKARYWQGKPVLTASCRGNTGDGIRLAQAVGADLWHMWHFHGCYAFAHPDPDFPFALRVKRLPDWNPTRKAQVDVPMAWIVVDQHGRRYMNECPPYAQDTAHRPMHFMDAETMTYPRIPSWLIADEQGRRRYQLGDVRTNDADYRYEWSADNIKEIELGILRQADSIDELAKMMKLELGCARRNDRALERGVPSGRRCRLRPSRRHHDADRGAAFRVRQVWPAVSNTQGGPIHNARQQIVDTGGNAIPRLYAAGELGSSFGHLYLSGGNIAECLVTGWVAGREAATIATWRN